MEMLKRNGEDALSESSGETGTSDSGRGGSEDDSHSNRGSAMIDPGKRHWTPSFRFKKIIIMLLRGGGALVCTFVVSDC